MDVVDSSEILQAKLGAREQPKRKSKVVKAKSKKSPTQEHTQSSSLTEECRFCVAKINTQKKDSFTRLDEKAEKRFFDLTQRTLKNSEQLSKFLCAKCEKRHKDALDYRQQLISVQIQLESQINEECFQNVFVKCEAMDFSQDPVGVDAFSAPHTIDQFEEELPSSPPPPVIKPKEAKSKAPRDKKDKNAICPECGRTYADKQYLKKHIKNVHIRLKKFFCDNCEYAATTKYSLKSHMRVHINAEDRRVHQCDQCSFISVSPQSLRSHIESKHMGVRHECMCGKNFSQQGTLQIHIKQVHEKRRDFVCKCGKSYLTKRDLENHIKMRHNPNCKKDFQCDQCGKAFITRRRLKLHLIYHTELKFRCSHCEKAYHVESKLKRHMKTHEGKRDLLCHLCDSSYIFMRDLQRHLDVVHKQTVYFCELCPFTNSRKDYLGNHLRSAHAIHDKKERNEICARAKFIRNNV